MIAELNSDPNQWDERINMSLLTKAGHQISWVVRDPNLLIKSKPGMHDSMRDAIVFNVP